MTTIKYHDDMTTIKYHDDMTTIKYHDDIKAIQAENNIFNRIIVLDDDINLDTNNMDEFILLSHVQMFKEQLNINDKSTHKMRYIDYDDDFREEYLLSGRL